MHARKRFFCYPRPSNRPGFAKSFFSPSIRIGRFSHLCVIRDRMTCFSSENRLPSLLVCLVCLEIRMDGWVTASFLLLMQMSAFGIIAVIYFVSVEGGLGFTMLG